MKRVGLYESTDGACLRIVCYDCEETERVLARVIELNRTQSRRIAWLLLISIVEAIALLLLIGKGL